MRPGQAAPDEDEVWNDLAEALQASMRPGQAAPDEPPNKATNGNATLTLQ